MPSDIYVKKNTGWSTAVTSIKAKTNTGWSSAIRYVYAKINAGWTRVWPLSGIYPTTNPFISNNTTNTSEIIYGTVLRVGTNYKGDRGVWNPNGYTISSYDYKWMAFASETGSSVNYQQDFSSLSGSTNTFLITGTTLADFDRGWITFRVRANASNSAYSGTADSLRYYVARQKPVISTGPTLSKTNPSVGDTISYSSGWNTTDAYKPDAARSTIKWYKSTSSSLTESQLKALTPIQSTGYSYIVQSTDANNYIYAMEEVFNSGTDLESLVNGVTAIAKTTSLVGVSPSAFSYSLTNVSSVTTPSAPVQQRVSSTSNTVLVEMSSAFPSDTESYELWTYGSGSAAGGTLANPSVQVITTLNQYFSNGDISYNGTFDTVTNISSSASNSPITTQTRAIGTLRTLQFNVSSTTGAQSWAINFTISGASGGNGTYTLNTNSMPAQTIISGVSNPTVTINSVTAYSDLDQAGASTAGSAGFPTSLSSITKPSAFSTTSTSNYTFYTSYQLTGSQRKVTLPSAFTSGTTIYVSTNGYINWGGNDPAGLTSIPTSGITIAPLAGDLRQGSTTSSANTSPGGLWTFADSTNYWVTWWGNYYQDAAQVARYQVKFYWGQSYADIYIVNNSLTTIFPSTTAVQNGANEYQNWSASTSQPSTLLSTASMNRISTQDGVDDNRTEVVASAPVLTWTVTWNAAGGTGGGTTTLARGLAHTAPSPGTRDGFDFAYYRYPASGGTDPVFVSSGGSYTPTQNVEFGAIWTTKTYTVSYNANGGTGAPSSQTKTHGVALTLSSTTPTRATVGNTSYTFNGWNTASDGTGTNYSAGGSYTLNAPLSLFAKWTSSTVVSVPTNVTQPTLSGGLQVGTTFTFGVGTWTGSPTSYDLRLYRGTPGVITSETLVKSAGNVTSSTYVIPQSDYDDPSNRRYYRAFASATNSAGTSNGGTLTPGVELGPITSAPVTPATAPGVVSGTPTNGWTGGTTYPVSWTAATPGTVSGGGAATISSYQIRVYEANDSVGTGSFLLTTNTSLGSGTTYTYTSPNAAKYYAFSISATNSAGLSSASYSSLSLYK